jgi:hypothetical protein
MRGTSAITTPFHGCSFIKTWCCWTLRESRTRALSDQLRQIRELAEQLGNPAKTELWVYVEKGVRPVEVRRWLVAARGAGMTDISLVDLPSPAAVSAPKGNAGSRRAHPKG